jgi:hypothetical protein
MSMKVTRTGAKFTDIDFAPARLMREIGEGLIGRIRIRTGKLVDANGQRFASLSPLYAAQKQKALGTSAPDLQVSGRMLNDMNVRPKPGMVTISFLSGGGKASGGTFIQRSRSIGAADKAFWHNESGAGRKRVIREFFGLDAADIAWAEKKVDAHLQRETR